MVTAQADLLGTIVAATRRIVDVRRSREPLGALMRRADDRGAMASREPKRFRAALQRSDRVNVIAECKRRSPSRGVLRDQYDPVAQASAYERAGAAAVSVLTEPTFFDGSLDHLDAVARHVGIPVLRKDFIVDEYQIVEARAVGADAVLLIVAALEDEALRRLQAAARAVRLDVLVEVHDAAELNRALAIGADLVGVNSRNLRTMEVDIKVCATLIAQIPAGVTAVAESGLKSPRELQALRDSGYQAFLIGERLMTSADPETVLREFLCG